MPSIFEKLDKAIPIYNWIYKIILLCCKLLLVADILIASYAVLTRLNAVQINGVYIFSWIPAAPWSEEIVLTLMSYMAVLSAALAIRRGTHIRMTAFDRYIPRKGLLVLDLLSDVAVLLLALVMLVVGWEYAQTLGKFGKYTSMPNLSRFWMYLPIPVAGLAMVIFQMEAMYMHVREFFIQERSE